MHLELLEILLGAIAYYAQGGFERVVASTTVHSERNDSHTLQIGTTSERQNLRTNRRGRLSRSKDGTSTVGTISPRRCRDNSASENSITRRYFALFTRWTLVFFDTSKVGGTCPRISSIDA